MYYIVNVEGAIVRNNTYLMILRSKNETHAGGTLSFVGGKVEVEHNADNILEDELLREIREEVGVEVGDLTYVYSSHFIADDNDLVVDVVFLCRYKTGEPTAMDGNEVEEVHWLTAIEVLQHPKSPVWVKHGIERVEALRIQLGW